MTDAPRALDATRLREALAGEPFVRELVVVESIGSTNDLARRLAAEGAEEGSVVLADQQTAGRGRLGRSWHSPPRVGLYVSVVLRPAVRIELLPRWTIAASLALAEACRGEAGAGVRIQWPNDLVAGERKVGGILAETRSTAGSSDALIVGAGVNVHHGREDFPEELAGEATSLALVAPGRRIERERLAAAYLCQLARAHAELVAGRFDAVVRLWETLAVGVRGWRVRVRRGPGAEWVEGTSAGLDALGGLRVELACGAMLTVTLADSLRLVEPREP